MRLTEKDEARFRSKVALPNEQGCMLWLGSLDTHGYGQIRIGGHKVLAHRVSYVLAYGPIPEGLQVDHVKARGCTHRHCAANGHLEAVTSRENTLRGNGPCGTNARKSHCPRVHPYDEANTYVDPTGRRHCRECARQRQRAA